MNKPQGTYLQVKAQDRTKAAATSAKATVAVSKAAQETDFYAALDKVAASQLEGWHKSMAALRDAIRKNEALSKEDKTRKAVSAVIGEVRKVLVKVKDVKTLEASLQRPATAVLRAPSSLGTAGAELMLVIALCQVLEVLVRLRKGKRT